MKRLLALLLALAMVAAACGSDSESDDAESTTTAAEETTATTAAAEAEETTTTAAPEPEPEPEPEMANELIVGLGNMPPSGMPYLGAGSPGQYVWSNVFDALTVVDADGSVAPALAADWSVADDNLTWTFNLRDDATFHNGDPLTAADVEATFGLVLSEDGRATYSANVRNFGFVDSVTAVDDTTVEIVTAAPSVVLPAAISIAYILPTSAADDIEAFAAAPVGTGPFQVDSWGADEIVLSPAGGWRGDPSVEKVTYLNLNDPATRLQALQSGQINVAQSPSPDSVESLQGDGFEIATFANGQVLALALITTANDPGPLTDVNVRRALNYAVDKEAIREALTGGFAASGGLYPPAGTNGYSPDIEPFPYDADMARQLLSDAGFGDGFDMVAELTLGGFPADREIFEAMQGYFADVGVNIELLEIDFGGDWLPKFLGTDDAFWVGNAFNLSWRTPPIFDAIRPFNFYQCNFSNQFYCDEDAQVLIDQINAEFDVATRNDLLNQLLGHTRENPPSVMLTENFELWATDPAISGFEVAAFNNPLEGVTVGG